MAVAVFLVHKRVVINKVLVSRVIRRIDIYHINLALMRICKSGKGFKVIALNEYMIRRIGIFADNSL